MFGARELFNGRIRKGGAQRFRRLSLGLITAGVLLTLGVSATAASATEPEDFSGSAYQILAPGDGGYPAV